MPIAEVKGPRKAPLRSSIPPFLTGFGLAEGPEAGLPARVAVASDYAPAGGSPDDAGAAHSTDTRHGHGAPPTLPATKSRSTGARWRRPGSSVRGAGRESCDLARLPRGPDCPRHAPPGVPRPGERCHCPSPARPRRSPHPR